MTPRSRELLGVLPLVVGLVACGGPPFDSGDDVAASLTHASFPSTSAQGAIVDLLGQRIGPLGTTVKGARGGEAVLSINPVGAGVGLVGRGVLFDVEYRGYSEDGGLRLDGTVSVLAQFEYVAQAGEPMYVDLKLSLVGRLSVGGARSDELRLNVTLLTPFQDLSRRADSVQLRLSGSVQASRHRFEFANEDLSVLWRR